MHLDGWTIFGIVATVVSAVAHGTISLTNMVPAKFIPVTTAWASFFTTVNLAIMTTVQSASPVAAVKVAWRAVQSAVMMVALVLVAAAMSAGISKADTKRPLGLRPIMGAAPIATTALTQTQAKSNPLSVLKTFTVNDLQAALDDANAQSPPDIAAANCYSALIPVIQSGIANPLPKGLGAFQALQKARDAKALLANIQSPNGPLAQLNIACAPLVMDAQAVLIQLGVVGGTVAATGGLGIALPAFLPGLLPFPIP